MDLNNYVICPACATGLPKKKHNYDVKHCRLGRLQHIGTLPADQQVELLFVEERLARPLAEMVVKLAAERNKSLLEVLQEEQFFDR